MCIYEFAHHPFGVILEVISSQQRRGRERENREGEIILGEKEHKDSVRERERESKWEF